MRRTSCHMFHVERPRDVLRGTSQRLRNIICNMQPAQEKTRAVAPSLIVNGSFRVVRKNNHFLSFVSCSDGTQFGIMEPGCDSREQALKHLTHFFEMIEELYRGGK